MLFSIENIFQKAQCLGFRPWALFHDLALSDHTLDVTHTVAFVPVVAVAVAFVYPESYP